MFWMSEAQQCFVDKNPAPEKINSPLLTQAQQVEDDRPKALPALGEQQNSNNGIRVCVHLGISDKAAWRKSISVEEGLFQLKPKEYQKEKPLSRLARGKDKLKPLHV
ncbi:unnamed protein product [Lepidochelys olivacea]